MTTAPPSPSPWIERMFLDASSASPVRYLLYLPGEYETASERWPLILFLHGDGERGDDLSLVKREGLPRILERNRGLPFVVVAPQLGKKEKWSAEKLERLLDHALETLPVDPRRVYVSGLSSGAVASLALALRRPDQIAAVAAISPNRAPDELLQSPGEPGRSPCSAAPAKPPGVWLFHNLFDERVPARVSRRIARLLEACGWPARLTIFPQAGHDAWSDAYASAELYSWLLDHRTADGEPQPRRPNSQHAP